MFLIAPFIKIYSSKFLILKPKFFLNKLINTNKSYTKRINKYKIQIVLIEKHMKFVNLINREQNCLLKPKKVRKLKVTIYL